jgi:hypothetical protein
VSKRGLCAAVSVLVCLLGWSAGASAQWEVGARGLTTGEYLYNTDEEASALDARVELDIDIGDLTLGAVYRAYQLSDPAYNPAGVDVAASAIKHRFVEYNAGDLFLRGGHFSATFGRGLSLRSYEDVELEHDTFLDGLMGEYRAGSVTVTALGGATNEDLSAGQYYANFVRAARVSAPVTGWLDLGASAVERVRTLTDEDVELPDDITRFEDVVLAGELDAWMGPVTLAADYASRSGENPVTGASLEGHGAYVSSTVDLGWMTLFGEVKDYDDYDHFVVNPPTCVREHLWTLMNRATYEVNLNDERGFLFEGNLPLGDDTYLTGGASESRRHNRDLSHWEMYGQYDQTFAPRVRGSLAGSWSREYLYAGDETTGKFTEHMMGAAEIVFGVGSDQEVELVVEGQRVEEPSGERYEDLLAAAAWYVGSSTTFTGMAETTTQEFGSADARDVWFMVEWIQLLTDDLEVKVGLGTQRGGKKCTGGVCYVEPEFEGARLKLAKYF